MKSLHEILITRMIHIENIPHILQYGITHKDSSNANSDYVPIGDPSIISTRDNKQITEQHVLGDFIPFYFGFRMPMLYVIQRGFNGVRSTMPSDIVYCISKIQNLIDQNIDFIFTDGHANNGLSEVYTKSDLEKLNTILDFEAIHSNDWKTGKDTDFKRRMEAEFLVLGDIPISAVEGFVVYNDAARNKLIRFGVHLKIVIKPEYYF